MPTESSIPVAETAISPARASEGSSQPGGRAAIFALGCVTFLSGLAGLGYEIVWTRMLSVALGHEIVSVLAVVASFFSGLALGALLFDRLIDASRTPGRWYAALEALIGLWALVLIWLLPAVTTRVPGVVGVDPGVEVHWLVAFLVPFLVLLPATAAMGGTLPALRRLLSALMRDGRSVGAVYALNTAGGVAGTMLLTFVVVPAWGFSAALAGLAAVNFVNVVAMLLGPTRGERALPPVPPAGVEDASGPRLLSILFVTGLLGIGYEVLVIRVLNQVLENTVFTFAAILSVYLVGTTLGAAVYQATAPRDRFSSVLVALSVLVACLCLGGTVTLWGVDALIRFLHALLGRSVPAAITAEGVAAASVFLLPTMGMGALFSHLAQGECDAGGRLGTALAVNMFGAALAPLFVGVLLLPAVGAKAALLLTAIGYLVAVTGEGRKAVAAAVLPAVVAVGLFVFAGPLQFVRIPAGGVLLDHVDGTMAAVSVVSDAAGDRHLQVDTHLRMGGTASMRSDRRQAHIPLLLHPDPRTALFLGLGTGATIAAVADHSGLAADGVELVPEILPMLGEFASANGDLGAMPRVRLHVADARRFVRAAGPAYDVIVADLFHPWIDGAGFLYTREHFRAVRARLAPDGLFCQWLPLHQLDLPTLRLVVRTFLDVFPDARAYLGTYSLSTPIVALVGALEPRSYPADWWERRVRDDELRRRLQTVGLGDGLSLFGLYLAGADDLRRFAGDGPPNTDDRPLVLFRAPDAAYAMAEPSSARLLALLHVFRPHATEVLGPGSEAAEFSTRLEAYWAAREPFIEAGLHADPTWDTQTFARRTVPDLLGVVRISPDFEPAVTPLLAIVRALSRTDPAMAAALRGDLARALQGISGEEDTPTVPASGG